MPACSEGLVSADLERTYVATILAQPSLVDAHRVAPEALSHEPYALALATILKLRTEGQRVTPLALAMALPHAKDVVQHLRETPVELDLAPVAEAIRTASRARTMAAGAASLARAAERKDLDACRDIISRLVLAHDAGDVEQPVMSMRELLAHTVEAIASEASETRQQIPLGMPQIDASYRLSPGQMLVVGAQTNVGKSSLITTWLFSIAKRGVPVGLVSVEDPVEDFGAKILADIVGINSARLWSGKLSAQEWRVLTERGLARADAPFSFAGVASRKIDDVLARVEFMVRVRGVRVVAVDYLQAISHRPGHDIRQRIDATLEELLSLCGRLGVALILASQLARPDKGSPFREPQLIDLKESGSIENRAQCVVMLWRDDDQPGTPIKAKIAKAKRQPAGVRCVLARDPDTGMLVDEASVNADDAYAVAGRSW